MEIQNEHPLIATTSQGFGDSGPGKLHNDRGPECKVNYWLYKDDHVLVEPEREYDWTTFSHKGLILELQDGRPLQLFHTGPRNRFRYLFTG